MNQLQPLCTQVAQWLGLYCCLLTSPACTIIGTTGSWAHHFSESSLVAVWSDLQVADDTATFLESGRFQRKSKLPTLTSWIPFRQYAFTWKFSCHTAVHHDAVSKPRALRLFRQFHRSKNYIWFQRATGFLRGDESLEQWHCRLEVGRRI